MQGLDLATHTHLAAASLGLVSLNARHLQGNLGHASCRCHWDGNTSLIPIPHLAIAKGAHVPPLAMEGWRCQALRLTMLGVMNPPLQTKI